MSSTGRPSLPLLSFLKNASHSQGPYNALALTSENVGGGGVYVKSMFITPINLNLLLHQYVTRQDLTSFCKKWDKSKFSHICKVVRLEFG